jgi:hypothetical protein
MTVILAKRRQDQGSKDARYNSPAGVANRTRCERGFIIGGLLGTLSFPTE